ncbi:MAG: dinitrogenase iron-molybdenum cofactor N-terminal domain-containing protein, partial [Cyanobacteriota bacterium]|nr:dinitrogenase iron-molybdenum cofactor N-terminal domain-containing protein [Cyanobacteriota bacterium]
MMTSEDTISPEVALRIALATRVLSEVSVGEMIEALQDCVGDTINEDSLSRVTVASLKTAFGHTNQVDGEEDGEDGTTAEIAAWKEAVAILWGQNI